MIIGTYDKSRILILLKTSLSSLQLSNQEVDITNQSFIQQWYPDLLISSPTLNNIVSTSDVPNIDYSMMDDSWNVLPFAGSPDFDVMEWRVMEKEGLGEVGEGLGV